MQEVANVMSFNFKKKKTCPALYNFVLLSLSEIYFDVQILMPLYLYIENVLDKILI